MPGLMRGIARTAVIAGTATAVSNNVSRRQANRWSQQVPYDAAPATPPTPEPVPAPSGPSASTADELRKLAALRAEGVITDDEFAVQKARMLG